MSPGFRAFAFAFAFASRRQGLAENAAAKLANSSHFPTCINTTGFFNAITVQPDFLSANTQSRRRATMQACVLS